jgi:heme-degrading monooxygenase HmoA
VFLEENQCRVPTKLIIRMWHGRVRHEDAKAYGQFLRERAIPDYRSVRGNIDVKILERRDDDSTHFITMTSWESIDAIIAFAGKEAEKAKYYPEDDGYLLEFEPTVVHYELIGES